MEQINTDFIVIGSGLAGLKSALYASNFGNVSLLTKSTLDVSNSYWAQGGIAAAIGPDDSPEFHFNDTIIAGAGLCDKESVRILVYEGVERIKETINEGLPYDKQNGEIALGLEGNHSKRRVLHAGGDATGREMVKHFLAQVVANPKIQTYEQSLVFSLIVENNICCGVNSFDWKQKKSFVYRVKTIIIATGGASGMYSRTTNPHSTTGDGIVLAYNAGADVANMEFVQFHPSSLMLDSDKTFLISEAVRGEGAYLVNSAGERFMSATHELAELAPRDVVAYEMYKQYKIPGNKVFLKLDHLDPVKIKDRFSNIFEELQKYDIDLAKDPVPVAPAAHYMIGGIKTGLYGETNIRNLYAVGEVSSTGVHGANRLASNSLLECLVFAKRAVDHSLTNEKTGVCQPAPSPQYYIDASKEEVYLKYKNEIADLLSNKVGIVRSATELNEMSDRLRTIGNTFEFSENEYYSMRLKTLLVIVELMSSSALIREESRGAHKRLDFPETKNDFLCELILNKNHPPTMRKLI